MRVDVHRDGPESYKEFILNLPNDVTPEEAHQRYQDYLAEWHGSAVKAEFERFKEQEWWELSHSCASGLTLKASLQDEVKARSTLNRSHH